MKVILISWLNCLSLVSIAALKIYLILDVLDLMLESITLVQARFATIGEPEDFVVTSDGVTLFDA